MKTILRWITLPLRAIVSFFTNLSKAQDIEWYLGQATDHADLERRLNNLRYGNHFGYNSFKGGRL
jgi:hypothetical protein